MRKRLTAVLLCFCMLFALLPASPAWAETADDVKYIYYNLLSDGTLTRIEGSAKNATIVESSDSVERITWKGGWYVVRKGDAVTFNAPIEIQGDVCLILEDDCSMTTNKSIIVNEGNSLTIYGQKESSGKLKIDGIANAAALGSEPGKNCGKIIIYGGDIKVTGKGNGAGIGGGRVGDGGSGGDGGDGYDGYISIYGGKVEATGGSSIAGFGGGAAGIGSGLDGDDYWITIYGGTVTANGSGGAAGIGCGQLDKSPANRGTITIFGGDVTATGGGSAAGIGGSREGGTINIYDGTIMATGGEFAAGIGGGSGNAGGSITITGGTVKATGGWDGAGIGGSGYGGGGTINISGGEVTATGGGNGAGIGGGGRGGSGGDITITGGTVIAKGGGNGACIGCGGAGGSGGAITISGGMVTATEGWPGIKGDTFSTGQNGNAILYANTINPSSDQSQWSGIIFQGGSGQVYDSQTLAGDFTVEEGQTLTIAEGASLTVPKNITLTNKGTIPITGSGVLINNGKLDNSSGLVTIAGNNSVVNTNTGTIIRGPQSAPTPGEGYTIDYKEETLSILSGYEVFTAQNGGTEIFSGGLSDSLGKTFYIRKAEYITQFASDRTEFTIPTRRKAPDAPTVTDRTDTTITIDAVDGMEYRLEDNGQWQTGQDGSLTFGGLTAEKTYTIYARYAAVTSSESPAFVSEESRAQATTKAAPGQAPAVTGIDATDTTITLPYNAEWEYSTDKQNWNSTHEFTGLMAATEYTFYVRVAETDDAEASTETKVKVYTAYAAPAAGTGYTIHFDTETLTIDNGYEVNTAVGFTGTGIADGGSLAGYTGKTLYIRHAADDDGAPASAAAELLIPARPAAPQGVTGDILKINGADTTMEYSTDNGATWTAFTDETVSSISAGTYWVRYPAAAGTKFASESVEVTVTQRSSGGGVTTYPVTVADTEHGTVTASHKRASRSTLITITATPDLGYELESLTVLDSRGEEITLTDKGDGKYTFTMPASKVTVEASFLPTPLPFEDVTPGAWYESAVRYAYFHNIMEGMSETEFAPATALTRAMAAQILYNLEGQPTVSGENEFIDVSGWYETAVTWAAENGVATGYGDGTFQPGDSITRQEFAQMLYNYAKYKGYDLTAAGDLSQFPDSNTVADWAEAAMSWANGNELINGHDDGTIDAAGTAIRAQAASILMRFDQNLVKS